MARAYADDRRWMRVAEHVALASRTPSVVHLAERRFAWLRLAPGVSAVLASSRSDHVAVPLAVTATVV